MGLAAGGIAAGVGTVAAGALSASAAGTAAGGAADAAKLQIKQQQNAVNNSNNTFGNVATALQPYTNTGQLANQGLDNALVNGTYNTNTNLLNQASGYTGQAAGSYGQAGNEFGAANNAYGQAGNEFGAANNLYSTLQNGPTQAQLAATPGYQFTLNQGLESTQNSAAARGLGNSGAALKGAAAYATGLANSTYQNDFNDMAQVAQGYNSLGNSYLNQGQGYTGVGTGYLNQGQGYGGLATNSINQQAGLLNTNQQNFNMLMQPYQTGLQAAGDYGSYATNTAGQVNAGLTGVGQAGAAGAVGSANANAQGLSNIGGAVSGLGSSLQQNLLLNQLNGGGGGGLFGNLFGSQYSNGITGSSSAAAVNAASDDAGFSAIPNMNYG
jgi:hypothetical protein